MTSNATFLSGNLNALPQDVGRENMALQKRLEAWGEEAKKNPKEPSFHVYETHAGDLTILLDDKVSLHDMEGATAEAQRIAEENIVFGKYGINVLVGLGLGYTLQCVVDAIRAKGSRARIIIYEPNLELLHFTLNNVNLREYLSYENLLLFTEPEQLLHHVETNLVQGDGLGIHMPKGYAYFFHEKLVPLMERMVRHAENAIRNANVLRLRSKLWTEEFLKNIPDLPSANCMDTMRGHFEGKTAVLCGAGPSLNDVLPHLHAVRDKIVICAVTGAVKALNAHGLHADFVFGMDYAGPSKQLSAMEEPLKNSHIITGPSAEHYIFEAPCKSRWIAALRYNDQYTQIVKEMYEIEMVQHNSGGTVSFFMLLICVGLGFDTIILAGQDMALRGNQVYATGETSEIKDGRVVLKDLHSRSTALMTVEGWNGETLNTQDDYRHFKYHYDNVREKIRTIHPNFEIYNCSVGGARIEGMENLRIEELLPRLGLDEQISVDAVVKARQAFEQTFENYESRAQRLYNTMNKLLSHTENTLEAAKKAQASLKELRMMRADSWTRASEIYSNDFNEFSELLEDHAFLRDTLYHEQLTIYQAYNDFAETEADHRANFQVDADYLKMMVHMLGDRLVPILKGTIERLQKKQNCVADEDLTVSINIDF